MRNRTVEELQRIRDTFYVVEGNLFRCKKYGLDDLVGKLDRDGYLTTAINLNGKYINLKVHHICWFIYYDKWPVEQLDHKDGNKLNNKKDNLQISNEVKQQLNPSTNTNQTYPGIANIGKRYRVRVSKSGVRYHVGYFYSIEEAIEALKKKYKELYGEDLI